MLNLGSEGKKELLSIFKKALVFFSIFLLGMLFSYLLLLNKSQYKLNQENASLTYSEKEVNSQPDQVSIDEDIPTTQPDQTQEDENTSSKPEIIQKSETLRFSKQTLVLWQNRDLGIQVITPKWIEYRYPQSKNPDGTWNYTDWERINPDVITDTLSLANENFPKITLMIRSRSESPYIAILPEKYKGNSFTQIARDLLVGTGLCGETVANQAEDFSCEGEAAPCYTKQDLLQNLVKKDSGIFDIYPAELWGLTQNFSEENDCRATDTWILKVKAGNFILTTIYPDEATIRLSSL